jgi:hypothetical protein
LQYYSKFNPAHIHGHATRVVIKYYLVFIAALIGSAIMAKRFLVMVNPEKHVIHAHNFILEYVIQDFLSIANSSAVHQGGVTRPVYINFCTAED